MKLMILSIILYAMLTNISFCKRPYILNLNTQDPVNEIEMDYEEKQHGNIFDVRIDDEGILEGNKLYLIMESSSRDLYISIYKDNALEQEKNVIMDLTTMSGNLIMVMSDTFFKGHLKFFQEQGSLRFKVKCHEKNCPVKYKIKVQIQEQGELTAGQIYTTRVDQSLKNIQFLMSYKGHDYPDLHKLRFQLQTIKKHSKFSLSAKLIDNNGSRYVLNELYKNTVGGLIDKNNFSICTSENCDYTLQIDLEGVKSLNIESFLGEKIEELKYDHYGPYYEKTYQQDQEINYILKHTPEIDGLDISISLIPVTSHSALYVNSLSKPNEYSSYDWQEKSPLAKRITIKNEELSLMKAEKEDLYITVVTQKPGEYLVKINAHEPGIRGTLHEGIIEDGFVLADEVVNYIYMFEIFKSQEIKFSIKMNVSSGDADLFMKQCSSLVDCNIDTSSEDKEIYKVTNNHSNKTIDHEFKCNHDDKYQATICNFAIAVKGKENNGTHYNLVLHEQQNHRLIMPGHNIKLDLNSEEIQYLKFSYPSKSSFNAQLNLEVDAIWGNFTVYISKTVEFPSKDNRDYQQSFYSSQTGLYNSMKQIDLSSNIIKDARIEGTYYIGVEAITSCAVNVKFYEVNGDGFNIHSLYAGEQQRGSLKNSQDVIYYSIMASLEQNQASSITINLTPLKGKFVLFTSRKGKIPTKDDFDLTSKNNTLELSYDDYQNQEEHIIGVQLLNQDSPMDSQFQFYISFNYQNKPLKLKPGIISNYTIQKQNLFLIEITVGMIEFVILKGNSDGYNVNICASFIGNDIDLPVDQECVKKIESKNMAIFFNEQEVDKNCKQYKANGNKCYIMLNVTGDIDQAFTLGYSFNDHPFQIQREQMIYGPNIQKGDYKLNFILHLEKQKEGGLYFNSKGLNLNVYTKLIKGDDQENSILLPFPTSADNDQKNRVQRGHSTTIQYTAEDVAQHGDHPELLISVRPSIAVDKLPIFDGKNYFIMQSAQESREILRTQVHHELLNEEEYYYYHFYNNGQNSVLSVQVSSEQPTLLEVMISRNKESRPPINDTYLVKETGFGQVTLNLDDNVLAEKSFKDVNLLKGWYTIAVKTSESNFVNIYWNNKQEFDYIELTPGTPTNITLNEKTVYFSFFAQDTDPAQSTKDKGSIKVYFRSDSRANVFVLQSTSNEIQAPEENNFTWQTQLPKKGGINVLEILPSDKNYCLECTYIGSFESVSTGQVTILVDIEHDDIPIFLTPGLTFPELLNVNKTKLFRLYNSDTDAMNLQFSVLSGQIKVFVSSDQKNIEKSKQNFVLDELRDRYKYFKIRPSDFNVSQPQDYFVLIKNNGRDRASFNFQLVKNNLKTPIEPGLTKSVLLGDKESVEYFFKTINSNEFQITIEVTNVYSDVQNVQLTQNNLEIYVLKDQNKKYKLEYEIIGRSDRKMVVKGTVQINQKQDVIVELYNDTNIKIQYNVQLEIGGYRLVNLDEYNIEHLSSTKYKIFEVYGKKGEFLFVDLRMCYGDDLKVAFYQSDYNKISKKDFSDYKTIKDSHSIVHYLTLQHERLFIKVYIPRNSTIKQSVFDLNVFNQKHLDENPYTAINHTNDGIVQFDTVNMQVTVDPVLISSRYSEEYRHKLTYTVYLSQKIEMMRYAKNCDQYFLKDVHNENDVQVFKRIYDYQSISEVNTPKDFLVRINVNGLQRQKKYYGIVVLRVELFSADKSQVKPVKSGRAYYDEFIVQTQHWNFSFYGFVGVVMIAGVLYCIFLIINLYVFGNIKNYKSITKLSDLVNLENETYDFNAGKVLQSEFFMEQEQEYEQQEDDQQKNPHEFELSTNQF